MDEVNHAVLDNLREFFSRVDSARNSVSPIEKPDSDPIDIKDFIGWCNEPCDYYPKSSKSDSAYRLGQTICALGNLSDNKPKATERILENLASSTISDTKMPLRDRTMKLLGTEGTELLSRLEYKPGKVAQILEKELPENVAFYFALKLRLKDCPDEQGYYHYQFDDSDNTIARIDPLKPFTDNAHDNLNQQWHVLISLLAYLDVAHALSSDHHEYHCLYPYLSSYDKGDLNKRHLRLGWEKVRGTYCRVLRVVNINQDKSMGGIPPHSAPMMDWIEKALTGKLASENAQ